MRYETHFYKSSLNEKNAMDEMEISENGPSKFRAKKLLVVAMDKYLKKETKSGQWHFTRQSTQNLINFGVDGSGKTAKRQNTQLWTISISICYGSRSRFIYMFFC